MIKPGKEQIKKIAQTVFTVFRSPLIWFLAIVIGVVIFYQFATLAAQNIALWKLMITWPEPERCALCTDDNAVRSYPCLVKLETGQAGEIRVYDIGSEYLNEIHQFRDTGFYTTFSFLLDCVVDTTTQAHSSTSTVTLPEEAKHINPSLYCRDCRAKIGEAVEDAGITDVGYVLADMYDPKHTRIYPIADGAEYDIQGYTVKVSKDKENKGLMVSVTGYFD